MAPSAGSLASPRLARLARHETRAAPREPLEHCELCSEPIEPEHRHLLDLEARRLLCACRACSILFDRPEGPTARYRLVPSRRLRLDDFELDEPTWERLRLPVEMAFFFHSSAAGRVTAFYPSPMGATESRLEIDAWSELEAANPVLGGMAPDVEALLVDHSRGAWRQWLVPIEDCYRLVAVIRTKWRGFSGGKEVWVEIDGFFDRLEERARPHREAINAKAAEGSS
ncbi:MAG TPA: DUF5947 family protein [Solirubrobacteraceae bacterium]|jgi:hypothetical protein|nr:DUF5947 family protein [Solirubrobacteraceae bacterium]